MNLSNLIYMLNYESLTQASTCVGLSILKYTFDFFRLSDKSDSTDIHLQRCTRIKVQRCGPLLDVLTTVIPLPGLSFDKTNEKNCPRTQRVDYVFYEKR